MLHIVKLTTPMQNKYRRKGKQTQNHYVRERKNTEQHEYNNWSDSEGLVIVVHI